MKVSCPRCGAQTVYAPENPFRPFCTERCKLIDFGDWASERFAIPVEHSEDEASQPESENENEDEDGSV